MLCTTLKFKVKTRRGNEKTMQTNWEELRLGGMRNEFEATYQRAHVKMVQRRGAATAEEGAEVMYTPQLRAMYGGSHQYNQ